MGTILNAQVHPGQAAQSTNLFCVAQKKKKATGVNRVLAKGLR